MKRVQRQALHLNCLLLKPSLHSPLSRWWADVQADWLPCSLCFFLDTPSWSLGYVGLRLLCNPGWGISLPVPSIRLHSTAIAIKPGAVPVVTTSRWQRVPVVKLGTDLQPPSLHHSLNQVILPLYQFSHTLQTRTCVKYKGLIVHLWKTISMALPNNFLSCSSNEQKVNLMS